MRDIADRVGITERITSGNVLRQAHLPLLEPSSRDRMVGNVLALSASGDLLVADQP